MNEANIRLLKFAIQNLESIETLREQNEILTNDPHGVFNGIFDDRIAYNNEWIERKKRSYIYCINELNKFKDAI
jgi:hypothetical protein